MKRNQKLFTEKLCGQMRDRNCDALILTTPYSVYYSTGFASSFLYKMNQAGLAAAVITADERVRLIASEFESGEAGICGGGVEVITYPTFIYVDDFARGNDMKSAQNDRMDTFRTVMEILDGEKTVKTIGVEQSSLPYEVYLFFESFQGKYDFRDAQDILQEAKAYKTPWEIETLRKAAEIDERAMEKTGHDLCAGMSHARIINRYQRYCLEQSDDIIEINQFHTFGEKFSPTYILSDRQIYDGDIVRLDGGPTIDGYYSDIARNYPVGGTMTDEQKRIYRALWKGYETGIKMIRPGRKMSDVFRAVSDAVVKAGIDNYSRGHFGHSIGCGSSAEEYPFIGRDEERLFLPGMVMCFEVPYYSSRNHSFNIEDTFLVTEQGVEFFTHTTPIV